MSFLGFFTSWTDFNRLKTTYVPGHREFLAYHITWNTPRTSYISNIAPNMFRGHLARYLYRLSSNLRIYVSDPTHLTNLRFLLDLNRHKNSDSTRSSRLYLQIRVSLIESAAAHQTWDRVVFFCRRMDGFFFCQDKRFFKFKFYAFYAFYAWWFHFPVVGIFLSFPFLISE